VGAGQRVGDGDVVLIGDDRLWGELGVGERVGQLGEERLEPVPAGCLPLGGIVVDGVNGEDLHRGVQVAGVEVVAQ
jgi:hypothetical protein